MHVHFIFSVLIFFLQKTQKQKTNFIHDPTNKKTQNEKCRTKNDNVMKIKCTDIYNLAIVVVVVVVVTIFI